MKSESHPIGTAGDHGFRLSLSAPNLESLLSDGSLLGLWELIRLSGRPVTLAEVAKAARLDPSTAQRRLDVLIAHDLVVSLPIKGRRRATSYQPTCGGLVVECALPEDGPLVKRILDRCVEHARGMVITDLASPLSDPTQPMKIALRTVLHMSTAESEELNRRLQTVADYVDMLREKRPSRGEMPCLSNYEVNLCVNPLQEHALPMPHVRFMDRKDAERVPGPRPRRDGSRTRLSSREREVALALVRGLTRREVAEELGIATSTVGTLTKRIHAKLGVRRRAELVVRVRELVSGPGD